MPTYLMDSLMQMSEIEREETIALRLEEKQKLKDKRLIAQMVKEQNGSVVDGVAKTAKRQHVARGATKEKSRKLDELKAKRRAKDEKARNKGSPKRDRSSSPMDMEISDEESEDGQITKYEQEEEKDRKMFSKAEPELDQPATVEDLEKCRLSRDLLAKHCMAPWFQDYVQDTWVRYLVGPDDNGQPVYRICQILNLAADFVKPYRINDKTVNQALELKHGKSVRSFPMDKVSNAVFSAKEFERWARTCAQEDVKLPTKKALEKKVEDMARLVNQPITESDINAMLARKQQLNNNRPTGLTAMDKSRLIQARTLAQRRQDYAEVAEIDAKLAELTAALSDRNSRRDETVDMVAKVNERNRKANLEAVRKAELVEAERKRRERKFGPNSGTQTPIDPSARLKIKPRLFDVATPTTRPGTPNTVGTPASPAKIRISSSHSISPLPPAVAPLLGLNGSATVKKSLEATLYDSIEIDLGDF
ncbi:hypothetical protein DXG03_007553 [Asterophora parasitica]|uniref:Plus3 domain-containing protein n=1 Tax=Asterophora parasitica TaxID=117018 RepID=A0A9P7G7A4_9AGAR|nr:hypothetical protein DXG03_007553 [Asterophora parasitica]